MPGTCLRGHELPVSSGPYGPRCATRIRQAAELATELGPEHGYTPGQVEAAHEALTDGAVVPTPWRKAFRVVSSDGLRVYLTMAQFCTCPASGPCYHRAAVEILTAVG